MGDEGWGQGQVMSDLCGCDVNGRVESRKMS